jgi:hypothetical protein
MIVFESTAWLIDVLRSGLSDDDDSSDGRLSTKNISFFVTF